MIKRNALIALIALNIMTMRPVADATTVTFDGDWWTSLDERQKLGVVEGLIAGYPSGWGSGAFVGTGFDRSLILNSSKLTLAEKSHVLDALSQDYHVLGKQPKFSKIFATYEHGIDDFYANHPDRMTVEPAYLIDCLEDTPARSCDSIGVLTSK